MAAAHRIRQTRAAICGELTEKPTWTVCVIILVWIFCQHPFARFSSRNIFATARDCTGKTSNYYPLTHHKKFVLFKEFFNLVTCQSSRISNAVLNALCGLTKSVQIRIHHCTDASLQNLKNDVSTYRSVLIRNFYVVRPKRQRNFIVFSCYINLVLFVIHRD